MCHEEEVALPPLCISRTPPLRPFLNVLSVALPEPNSRVMCLSLTGSISHWTGYVETSFVTATMHEGVWEECRCWNTEAAVRRNCGQLSRTLMCWNRATLFLGLKGRQKEGVQQRKLIWNALLTAAIRCWERSSLTVLLMDLGRLSSRTGPWSSSESPKSKDTMRGSLKSGRAWWEGAKVKWKLISWERKQQVLHDPSTVISYLLLSLWLCRLWLQKSTQKRLSTSL